MPRAAGDERVHAASRGRRIGPTSTAQRKERAQSRAEALPHVTTSQNAGNNPATSGLRAIRMLMLLVGSAGPRRAHCLQSKGPHLKGFAFQRRKLVSLSAAVVAVGASTGFISTAGASAAGGTLNGAGSTLVAPLEAEWASAFGSKTGNTVNYNPVGSGTGIAQISAGTVDFGASDAPLNPTQAAGCQQLHPDPVGAVGHGRRLQRPGRRPQAAPHRVAAGGHLPGSDHHLERLADRPGQQGRPPAQPEDHAGVPLGRIG